MLKGPSFKLQEERRVGLSSIDGSKDVRLTSIH